MYEENYSRRCFESSRKIKNMKCFVCDSKNIFCLFQAKEYSVFKCRRCRTCFRFPQPPENIYLNKVSEYYRTNDPYFKVAHSREYLYKRFFNQIKKIKENSKILDIGCSYGYFLYLAKEKGLEPYGVEIVPEFVEIGKKFGINIQCTPFEKLDLPENYFDIITLWNIFDELFSPSECLIKIKKFLKPNGILFMRIPNADFHSFICEINKILEKFSLGKLVPYRSFIFHLFAFSNKSIRIMLEKNGFKNIKIINSPPTKGDPYNMKKGGRFYKFISFLITQFLFIITFRKLTFAPSIEIFAENGKN